MSASPPGRNDPCRCGSGRKYKRCCLETDRAEASERLKADALGTKLSAVQAPDFATDAPTPRDADRWLGEEGGVRPVALDGLSLAEYARLVHYEPTVDGLALADGRPDPASAAWAEGRVQVSTRLAREPEGEAAFLFGALLEAMPAGRALGLTRSSLLPRALVRQIARAHAERFPDSLHGPGGPIAVETDFAALHAVRLAAEDAGLLEVEDGVVAQAPAALALAERSGVREAFPRLLLAFATVYDWAYVDDGLPEAPSVQDAWLLALRLVRRHGRGEGVAAVRLARALTVASAEAVHEAAEELETEDEEAGRKTDREGALDEAVELTAGAFLWRSLVGFAELFGLASVTTADGGPRLGPDGEPRTDALVVRATAQLEDAVRFDPALLDGPDVLLAGALVEELERIDDATLRAAIERWGVEIGTGGAAGPEPSDAPGPGPEGRAGPPAGAMPESAVDDAVEPPSGPSSGPSSEAETGPASEDGRRRRPAHAARAEARRRRRRH